MSTEPLIIFSKLTTVISTQDGFAQVEMNLGGRISGTTHSMIPIQRTKCS